jgi:glutaredoxin
MLAPMRDTLFLLTPGFTDQGTRWFCPYCAQVTGMLTYFPALRDTLDIVEVDYAKPRQAIVALVGEEHQSCPVLVLGDEAPATVEGVRIDEAHGRRFVKATLEILRYLAATRGLPLPH